MVLQGFYDCMAVPDELIYWHSLKDVKLFLNSLLINTKKNLITTIYIKSTFTPSQEPEELESEKSANPQPSDSSGAQTYSPLLELQNLCCQNHHKFHYQSLTKLRHLPVPSFEKVILVSGWSETQECHFTGLLKVIPIMN